MGLISKNNVQEGTAENLINGIELKRGVLQGGTSQGTGRFCGSSPAEKILASMISQGSKR